MSYPFHCKRCGNTSMGADSCLNARCGEVKKPAMTAHQEGTPRTDAWLDAAYGGFWHGKEDQALVTVNFARTLERDLTAAREALEAKERSAAGYLAAWESEQLGRQAAEAALAGDPTPQMLVAGSVPFGITTNTASAIYRAMRAAALPASSHGKGE